MVKAGQENKIPRSGELANSNPCSVHIAALFIKTSPRVGLLSQ